LIKNKITNSVFKDDKRKIIGEYENNLVAQHITNNKMKACKTFESNYAH